jgi:hypothetical protein
MTAEDDLDENGPEVVGDLSELAAKIAGSDPEAQRERRKRRDADQILGLTDAGHGFIVVDGDEAPTTVWPTHCEQCGEPLTRTATREAWLCQYYDETRPASLSCNCSWCQHYQWYMNGSYKPQGGRPAKRCGQPDCARKAAAARKRKQRERERAARARSGACHRNPLKGKGERQSWPDRSDHHRRGRADLSSNQGST